LPPEVGVRLRPVCVTEGLPISQLFDLACQILARLRVSVCPLVATYDSRYCKVSFLVRRHIRRWDPDSQPALDTGSNPVSPTSKITSQPGFCARLALGWLTCRPRTVGLSIDSVTGMRPRSR